MQHRQQSVNTVSVYFIRSTLPGFTILMNSIKQSSLRWDSANSPAPVNTSYLSGGIKYIPRNMHTVFALLCFVVVIHWLIFPYPSGLLHWHCGNLTIAPVPAKQPWWIWINTSCEFIMNDCITTTKQSTTKPCSYFLGYTVDETYMTMNTLSTALTALTLNKRNGQFKPQIMWRFDKTSI